MEGLKDMTGIQVILGIVTITAVICLIVEKYRYRKTYNKINQMMDDILEQRKIEISDLNEGELSAFAGKTKKIQEKIELEVDSAKEEKEQIKSLISNLSHQLKTPLSNVMMYRELLEEELPKEQKQQFLGKMQVQLNKIDWILQSLFKMVRLEQGAIQFEVESQGIRDTIFGAVNAVYEKAEKKQACRKKITSAVAKRTKRHSHTLLNSDLCFCFFQDGFQLPECIDTDTESISIFTRF